MSNSILSLIGNTPLVSLNRIPGEGTAAILGKLESYNPTGSIKDRIALGMIEDAEATGRLLPGYTLVEPTSGNCRRGPGDGGRGQGLLPDDRYA